MVDYFKMRRVPDTNEFFYAMAALESVEGVIISYFAATLAPQPLWPEALLDNIALLSERQDLFLYVILTIYH
jgi:hypothetical protein